ncbi:HD domain-containing protein [Candidatus Microgenomates bacterium]|nr:MAG: HD domain-containing protein [Candidatus Microgenomates bacterium]
MGRERLSIEKHTHFESPENFAPSSLRMTHALEMCKQAHCDQFRKSGEPFYYHPVAVAQIIKNELGIGDENMHIAALLHDAVEDNSNFSLEKIEEAFGPEVRELVDGVTKADAQTVLEVDQKTIRKISDRSYLEPRVAILKLADRLHNMRTLEFMPKERQIQKSQETIVIFAPLAESLGVWEIKRELEDLSFKYLNPELYQEIEKVVDSDPRLNPEFLGNLKARLEILMRDNGVEGYISMRINGYWKLHNKREAAILSGKTSPDRGFFDINDLVSVRAIVADTSSCYNMVRLIHSDVFGALVDHQRYDEFMAHNVRYNGYSAIQTTLRFQEGATEIAIATEEMEKFNRLGVVNMIANGETKLERYVQKAIFSPEGQVKFMPKTATAIDYAYAQNPTTAARALKAIVNGQVCALATVISNGDVVEISMGPSRRAPNPDLLNYCLPHTQTIIREQLNLASIDALVESGRQIARQLLVPRGLLRLEDMREADIEALIFTNSSANMQEVYALIGRGAISESKLNDWLDEHQVDKSTLGRTTIELEGGDKSGILLEVAKLVAEARGNIVKIDSVSNNGYYKLHILIEGVSDTGEQSITDKLPSIASFERIVVV